MRLAEESLRELGSWKLPGKATYTGDSERNVRRKKAKRNKRQGISKKLKLRTMDTFFAKRKEKPSGDGDDIDGDGDDGRGWE